MPGYSYDAFISFSRSGAVRDWVANHFLPLLSIALNEQLAHEPALFADLSLETTNIWPIQLAEALRRSRCMVAIWSPSYFRSKWCASELLSVFEREQLVRVPGSLIVPVVFSGGGDFPDEAKKREAFDFRRWAIPFEQFRQTEAYIEFYKAVIALGEVVAARIKTAPVWSDQFPVLPVGELSQVSERATFPKLGSPRLE